MSETKHTYTHATHLTYGSGTYYLQWNGPRGAVRAETQDGKRSKTWEINPKGKALAEAMAWCRAGGVAAGTTKPPTTTEDKR